MDGKEDELLYECEDENENEVDSPDSDWDPYYDETVNDDLYVERFVWSPDRWFYKWLHHDDVYGTLLSTFLLD